MWFGMESEWLQGTLRYLGHEQKKNFAVGKQDLNLFPANDSYFDAQTMFIWGNYTLQSFLPTRVHPYKFC